MTDIVKRLRSRDNPDHWTREVREEAADKIEGLRNELIDAGKMLFNQAKTIQSLQAEQSQPVAWRCLADDGSSDVTDRKDIADQWLNDGLQVVPLYTLKEKT